MFINEHYQRRGKKGVIDILIKMKEVINKNDIYDTERITKETAKDIIKDLDPQDEIGQIEAIYQWVKNNLKYVRDIKGKEEITYPYLILKAIKEGRNYHSSDCDDFAILTCALLRSIGFLTRIEVIAYKSKRYNHARCSVYSQTLKRWLPLETTSRTLPVGKGFKSELPILTISL